ncbi:hypothetical protein KKHLCK_14365 [Candidatus Electrothrix laxa]
MKKEDIIFTFQDTLGEEVSFKTEELFADKIKAHDMIEAGIFPEFDIRGNFFQSRFGISPEGGGNHKEFPGDSPMLPGKTGILEVFRGCGTAYDTEKACSPFPPTSVVSFLSIEEKGRM